MLVQTGILGYLSKYICALETEHEIIPVYGADITCKMEGTLRIGNQNVNGMKLGYEKAGCGDIDTMDTFSLDLYGITETNLVWNTDTKSKLDLIMNMQLVPSLAITSSSTANDNGYQPGVTAMLLRGKLASRKLKAYSDPLGCYTYVILQGKNDTGVVIVNAY